MIKTISTIVLGGTAAVALATTVSATPAQASDAPGSLCRTAVATTVYSPNTGQPKYVIPAGRDMRVHGVDGSWFYGHGGGHGDDGWAYAGDFAYCR